MNELFVRNYTFPFGKRAIKGEEIAISFRIGLDTEKTVFGNISQNLKNLLANEKGSTRNWRT